MSFPAVNLLNDQFSIPNHLVFEYGPGEIPQAIIKNSYASARVSLQGAQVLTFQPHGQQPVLWVSRHSTFQPGKAIRGGVPICWPWFGPHPTNPDLPAHGFVRGAAWTVQMTEVIDDGSTQIVLNLTDSPATKALWPHAFDLAVRIRVGPLLVVDLLTRNTGDTPFEVTGALHSYFTVGKVTDITIEGLAGSRYRDQVGESAPIVQAGPITINAETDRIYYDTDASCTIADPVLGRQIQIEKEGSQSTVVWNPWVAKARRLADMGDEEYLDMVCVETANADHNGVTLASGAFHHLITRIRVAGRDEAEGAK